MSDDTARDRLFEEISETIRSLLTIEGVEGIGKPVTVISPGDSLLEPSGGTRQNGRKILDSEP